MSWKSSLKSSLKKILHYRSSEKWEALERKRKIACDFFLCFARYGTFSYWKPLLRSERKLMERYKDKKFCLIREHFRPAGFFSLFLHTLAQLYVCEKNCVIPVVYWGPTSKFWTAAGYRGSKNAWEYYFEPVSDLSIKDLVSTNGSSPSSDNTLIANNYFHTVIPSVGFVDESMRNPMNEVIKKYVRIRPDIMEEIDGFYDRHFRGKRVLGLFFRSEKLKAVEMEHHFLGWLSLQYYFKEVDRYLAANPSAAIFASTDSEAVYRQIKNRYGDRVFSHSDSRSSEGEDTYNYELCWPKIGEDVLISSVLLSKCDFLIHGISNVSTAACFFNPVLKHLDVYQKYRVTAFMKWFQLIEPPRDISMGIITGDAPLSEDTYAGGMQHIDTRLFSALSRNIKLIIITKAFSGKIDPELQEKSIAIRYGLSFTLLRKALNLFFTRSKSERIAFRIVIPNLVRKFKAHNINWLFCPCGSNPIELERALLIARAGKIPLAAYLVDDFLESALCSGNAEYLAIAKKDVPGWMRTIDRVFTVSEGLQTLIKERYNKDAVVLPIPYNLDKNIISEPEKVSKKQIIFVGYLSHFYHDGLKQLALIIDRLNKERGESIILRLTSPSSVDDIKRLIGDFKCIKCAPCDSIGSLHDEISQSLITFIPYSFNPKYKAMVQTSFPSKILPSLAAGRFILIYGPDYSSSVKYFQKHDLPLVLCTEDKKALEDIITAQITDRKNYSERYREVIRKVHLSEHIARKILVNL